MFIRPMLAVALTLAVLVLSVSAQNMTLPQRFTATAVSLGGPKSDAGTRRVDIIIERWSTPQERTELLMALKEQGTTKLLDSLHEAPLLAPGRSQSLVSGIAGGGLAEGSWYGPRPMRGAVDDRAVEGSVIYCD